MPAIILERRRQYKALNFLSLFGFQSRKCGYFKYFATSDENKPEFCYLLRSCAKRMIDNVKCTLGKNNFLDVKFFVRRKEDCQAFCGELV